MCGEDFPCYSGSNTTPTLTFAPQWGQKVVVLMFCSSFSPFADVSLLAKKLLSSSSPSVGKNMSRGSMSSAVAILYIDAVVSDFVRRNCAID